MEKKIIVLLAHGSPQKHAKNCLTSLRKKLLPYFEKNSFVLSYAFLQFNKPNLEECLFKILNNKRDYKKYSVIVLPVFLSQGRHTLYDVPKILKNIKRFYKDINIKLALPLGPDDLLVKLLYKRYKMISASGHKQRKCR